MRRRGAGDPSLRMVAPPASLLLRGWPAEDGCGATRPQVDCVLGHHRAPTRPCTLHARMEERLIIAANLIHGCRCLVRHLSEAGDWRRVATAGFVGPHLPFSNRTTYHTPHRRMTRWPAWPQVDPAARTIVSNTVGRLTNNHAIANTGRNSLDGRLDTVVTMPNARRCRATPGITRNPFLGSRTAMQGWCARQATIYRVANPRQGPGLLEAYSDAGFSPTGSLACPARTALR